MPLISVCIANYNGIGLIDACIAAVRAQEGDLAVEVIVHDDASTDDSVEHIRARHPEVRLIESVENVGFCIANNRMAQAARGEYLLLLNNDAELLPDALRTLHGAAVALAQPAILGLPQYDAATGDLIDIGSLFDPFLNPVPNRTPARSEVGMVIGACLWLPTSLWTELGGFPEWFGSLAEDMYLCCQARLRGYPVRALDRSGFRHWVGQALGGGKVVENRLSTTVRRRALSERNKSFVMATCFPAPCFYLLFPLHLMVLPVEGLLLALVKRSPRLFTDIYWTALKALWLERSRLQKLRKETQSRRRIRPLAFFSVFQAMPYKLVLLLRHGVPEIRPPPP